MVAYKPHHPELEWDLVRAFLAVVDAGSMTAAAGVLHTSQPTLSRQLNALEQRLGNRLFERVGRGLQLTSAGRALVEPARRMQSAANAFSLTSQVHSSDTAGTVRISASEMTATYVLPPILTDLRRHHPEIQIELAANNRVENLLEHEADIAVRHAQPEQGNIIARRIGDFALGIYAHHDYLARAGGLVDMTRLESYDWLGLDRSDLYLRGFEKAGMKVTRDFFAFRCDDQVALWQMVLAGMGIGVATQFVAGKSPELEQVLPELDIAPMPVWLSSHRELRDSARIRLVFEALAEGLSGMVSVE